LGSKRAGRVPWRGAGSLGARRAQPHAARSAGARPSRDILVREHRVTRRERDGQLFQLSLSLFLSLSLSLSLFLSHTRTRTHTQTAAPIVSALGSASLVSPLVYEVCIERERYARIHHVYIERGV